VSAVLIRIGTFVPSQGRLKALQQITPLILRNLETVPLYFTKEKCRA
jgi:hypothetical protein